MDITHLNRPQKRAQAIKEELTYLDPSHLDTFIEGVAEIEPPRYRRVGAKIVPDLVLVTLKKGANIYNLGNVYDNDTHEIKNVDIRMDNGINANLDRSDRLPKDDGNFLSTPILHFVAQTFVPLWKAKFQTIKQHQLDINSKRSYAHNLLNQKAPSSRHFGHANTNDRLGNGAISRKRASGEPVTRHSSNKRVRVGLLAIPDSAKCETFTRIEDRFKIELFDAMAKAAFPGFDNVMTAAWNVISIYSSVGSEFPELHKAMIELKSVLEEFDAVHGDGKAKTAPEPKQERENSGVNHRNSRSGGRSTQEESILDGARDGLPSPPQNDGTVESTGSEGMENEAQKFTRSATRNGEEFSDEETRKASFAKILDIHRSRPRYTPSHQREGSSTSSSNVPSEHQHEEGANEHLQQPYEQEEPPQETGRGDESFNNFVHEEHPDPSAPDGRGRDRNGLWEHEEHGTSGYDGLKEQQELGQFKQNGRGAYDMTKSAREESRDSMKAQEKANERMPAVESNKKSVDHNQAFDHPHIKYQDMRKPQPRAEKPTAAPVWLGSSKLGVKKSTAPTNGTAPVAPMMHTMQQNRKDANGSERRRQ